MLDMVVLSPMFGSSTTHIPSGHTCCSLRTVGVYLCSVEYGGAKTNICTGTMHIVSGHT